MAVPGQYTVRLTVTGQTFSEPLVVKMDPRVEASREDLALEFQKEQLLARMMTQNTEAITEARGLREQLQKLTGKSPAEATGRNPANLSWEKISGPLAEAVASFDKKLMAILGGGGGAGGFGAAASPSSTLSRTGAMIGALYGEIDRADAAPTEAQIAAIDTAERDFSATLKLWKDFQARDLPALNRQLKSAGVAELQLATPPPPSGDDGGQVE